MPEFPAGDLDFSRDFCYNRGMREKIIPIVFVTSTFLVGCTTTVAETELPKLTSPVQESVVNVSIPEDISTFEELWPTTFSRKELGHSALIVMEEYFASNESTECQWEGKRFSEKQLDISQELDLIVDEFVVTFCNELQDDPILMTGNYFFAKETLAELDRQTDEHGGICGGSAGSGGSSGCALFHSAWVKQMNPEMMMGVAAHELFHNVQDSVNPGKPTWRTPTDSEHFIPMWLIEGAAVTYQAAVIDHLGLGDYFMYDGGSSMLLTSPKTNINMELIEQGWSGEVYVVGQFATEYIIANVGFEPMLDIITNVGEGATFEESFEMNVGMSVADFYDKMSSIQISRDR